MIYVNCRSSKSVGMLAVIFFPKKFEFIIPSKIETTIHFTIYKGGKFEIILFMEQIHIYRAKIQNTVNSQRHQILCERKLLLYLLLYYLCNVYNYQKTKILPFNFIFSQFFEKILWLKKPGKFEIDRAIWNILPPRIASTVVATAQMKHQSSFQKSEKRIQVLQLDFC